MYTTDLIMFPLFDYPTNHLDLETVETLAKAFTTFLANYTVAMVLVITSLLHCTSTVHTIDSSSSSVCASVQY